MLGCPHATILNSCLKGTKPYCVRPAPMKLLTRSPALATYELSLLGECR